MARMRQSESAIACPCGNALRLAIEGRWRPTDVTTILQTMAEGQSMRKQLHYATGEVQLHPLAGIDTGAPADFSDDAQGLSVLLGPRHRLLLIGATEVSRYLLPIARSLGYAVTICDPRVEYTGAWSDPDTTIWHDMPDDAVLAFRCDARTAVITVTHDPKLDDLALMEALRSQAFYVGALGSSITTSKRKERLASLRPERASDCRPEGPRWATDWIAHAGGDCRLHRG